MQKNTKNVNENNLNDTAGSSTNETSKKKRESGLQLPSQSGQTKRRKSSVLKRRKASENSPRRSSENDQPIGVEQPGSSSARRSTDSGQVKEWENQNSPQRHSQFKQTKKRKHDNPSRGKQPERCSRLSVDSGQSANCDQPGPSTKRRSLDSGQIKLSPEDADHPGTSTKKRVSSIRNSTGLLTSKTTPSRSQNKGRKQSVDKDGTKPSNDNHEDPTSRRESTGSNKGRRRRKKTIDDVPEVKGKHCLEPPAGTRSRSKSTSSKRRSELNVKSPSAVKCSNKPPPREGPKLDLNMIGSLFANSLLDSGDVELKHYLLGYEELFILCQLLGPIFKIVGSDTRSKLDRMNALRATDQCNNFFSMMSMVVYENGNNLLRKPAYVSGSRTFLRLNRGLSFLVKFLQRVNELDWQEMTSTAGCEVYNETLAPHHSWMIRKSAVMVMSVGLPTKEVLVNRVCDDPGTAEYELPAMLDAANEVLRRAHEYFKLNDLLELP